MSTPFQNRLVGTIIVAAVAIIFLPDLLDGEKKSYQEEFDKIPPAPNVAIDLNNVEFPEEKIAVLKQDKIEDEKAIDDASHSNDDSDSSNQTTKVNTLEKSALIVDENKIEPARIPEKIITKNAWVIQLGSFRHKKNVDELVGKLKANGYSAFTKPIKTKNGTLTKVFVGPDLVKISLEKKIPALKKLTNVEGKIARFYPAKK